jgi:RNA polymerase sigma-70 factor (ECF subfamily)
LLTDWRHRVSVHQTIGDHDSAGVAALVARARDGDRAAFGRLYDRYARMVHAIAVTRGPFSEADDVVQEVFLRALRQLKALRSADAFGAWLAAIARRTVADVHRRPRHEGEEAMGEPATAGTQHEESEARAALEAIRRLPAAYRETVAMRLVEGMTGPEIADRTGLSPGSVRVNLHRGMKLLRQRLETGQRRMHA